MAEDSDRLLRELLLLGKLAEQDTPAGRLAGMILHLQVAVNMAAIEAKPGDAVIIAVGHKNPKEGRFVAEFDARPFVEDLAVVLNDVAKAKAGDG